MSNYYEMVASRQQSSPLSSGSKQEFPVSSTHKHVSLRLLPLVNEDTEEDSCVSSTARRRLRIRNTPTTQCKYIAVWKRVRAKVRSQLSLSRLRKDLNLYGTSLVLDNDPDILYSMLRIEAHKDTHSNRTDLETPISPLPWYLLHPDGQFHRFWNIVISLLLLYTASVMPYRLAFTDGTDEGAWLYIEYTVNVLFCMDVVLNCFSAIYSSEGDLVVSLREVVWRYAKGWMALDVVACFPFNLIDSTGNMSNSSGSGYNGLIRLIRVPRLYRLLRLSRLFKALKSSDGCMSRLQDYCTLKSSALRLFSFFLSVLGIVHLIACLWCFCPSLEGYSMDSWVVRLGYQDEDNSAIYIAAFYWAFTTLTTVGYGDITPVTPLEKVIAVVWMLLGICSFSFAIGSLTGMIAKLDTKETILVHKLEHIDEFSKEAHLTKDMRTRLRHALRYSTEHLGYSWHEKHHLFAELPKRLRVQVALAMYQGAVQNLIFFTERNEQFIASTVPFLLPLFVPESDFVYLRKDHPVDMYFITKGRCAVTITHKSQIVQLRIIPCGAYFGEIELIESVPRLFAVRTVADCDLLTLGKPVLKSVEMDFPRIYEEICNVANTRKELYREIAKDYYESLKTEKKNTSTKEITIEDGKSGETGGGRRRSLLEILVTTGNEVEDLKTVLTRAVSDTDRTLTHLETQLTDIKARIRKHRDSSALHPTPHSILKRS